MKDNAYHYSVFIIIYFVVLVVLYVSLETSNSLTALWYVRSEVSPLLINKYFDRFYGEGFHTFNLDKVMSFGIKS